MNAEMLSAGQPRILVPIIVRDEYITGLRAITRDAYAQTLVEVLSFGRRPSTSARTMRPSRRSGR